MTDALLTGAARVEVAVEGVRFVLHRGGRRRRGSTPVLLLHGVPQTVTAFRHLFPALAADRLVLAPELKGLGASEAVGPYDVGTLAREVAALVLHEIDGPVDVVGHDWGGIVALRLAEDRPDLVRRLVVVNAPYRKLSVLRAFHVPLFCLPALPELAFRLAGPALVRGMLRLAWRSSQPLEPEVADRYAAAYSQPGRVAAMLAYYRTAMRDRVRSRARLGEGQARPAGTGLGRLVLWGAADPVLPMPIAESVCHDLGPLAELVALPGVGHFPCEEAPGDVLAVVRRFLDEGDPSQEPPVAAAVALREQGYEEG